MAALPTPRRIACLQPSATVILDSVGELDRLVACTRYCADVVSQAADGLRTILADSWTANADEIVAVNPDLVIAAVPYQEKAVAQILKAGARFLGLAPRTLADIYTDIAIIAGAVGAVDRGQNVIQAMQRHIDRVRDRVSASTRPRVFCEEWGKPIIASQTWLTELVDAAGGRSVAVPARQYSPEDVRSFDPDVFVAAWCGAGDRVPLEKIIVERGWQQTSAALSRRVFCIRDEFLNTPAPTLLHGLDALAYPRPTGIRQITSVMASTTGICLT